MTEAADPHTPDEYRYAASHLKAALGHVRLALHYAGNDQVAMDELKLVTADLLTAELNYCIEKAKG